MHGILFIFSFQEHFAMMNDIVFKTKAFGGFKKDEVMSFINGLLAEKSNVERQLANMNATAASLNQRVRELEYELAAQKELSAKNDELCLENDSLKAELSAMEDIKAENESLKARISEEKALSETLKAELSVAELDGKTAEELKSQISALKAENERMKNMEQQVGAAMLDARLHSDELVKEAREKANMVTKEIYSAIGDTALKIDSLSSDIGEIARNFTKAAEEVELRINVLTGNMSKTAQALISESVLSDGGALPSPENGESDAAKTV